MDRSHFSQKYVNEGQRFLIAGDGHCGPAQECWCMRLGTPVLWILCAINVYGQSVSVASPNPNQTLSGFSGFSFAASITSGPNAYNVCYTVDAYPVPGPGRSCSHTPP